MQIHAQVHVNIDVVVSGVVCESRRALTAVELVGAILALFGAIAALPGRDAGMGPDAGELAPGAGRGGSGGRSDRVGLGAVGG